MPKSYTTEQPAAIAGLSVRAIGHDFGSGRLRGLHVPGSRFRGDPAEPPQRFPTENGIPTAALDVEAPPPTPAGTESPRPPVVPSRIDIETATATETTRENEP